MAQNPTIWIGMVPDYLLAPKWREEYRRDDERPRAFENVPLLLTKDETGPNYYSPIGPDFEISAEEFRRLDDGRWLRAVKFRDLLINDLRYLATVRRHDELCNEISSLREELELHRRHLADIRALTSIGPTETLVVPG